MYAEPLEVLDRVGQVDSRKEVHRNVSTGANVELENKYLIQEAFTVNSNKQDIVITVDDGSTASTSDYKVDLRDGSVTWNGTDSEDLTIRYKTAPLPNSEVVSEIEAATERIDDFTNTTFNGLETVTETYDVNDVENLELVLFNRPVRSIDSVRINEAKTGSSDDFNDLDIGRDKDVFRRDDLSIEFTTASVLYRGSAVVEVTYSYGYQDVPSQIADLTKKMAIQSLAENTVMSEILEGRDDYGTQIPDSFNREKEKVLSSWRIQRMGEPVPVDLP